MAIDQVRQRPGGRSAHVRAAVLGATLELLAEAGPKGVTFGEVAVRSGVHETSIYRRWGNRDRLLLDALSERSEELIHVPNTGSVRGDLAKLGQAIVAYASSPVGEGLMRTLAASTDDNSTAEVRHRFWTARFDACRIIVDRAKQRGELPDAVDPRVLLEAFISPIHFRLLLTREPVDAHYLLLIADIAVSGVAAARSA